MIRDLQKAGISKRLSAFLFDMIIVSTLAVMFLWIFSAVSGYDRLADEYFEILDKYGEEYGISFTEIGGAEIAAFTEEEETNYLNALDVLLCDERFVYLDKRLSNLRIMQVSLSIFFAVALWEFVIPLILKNGMTVGKKIFALGVMRTDHVKVTPFFMFVRTILGKYTLEIMIPAFIIYMMLFSGLGLLGLILLAGILILQIICLAATRTRSALHDLLAGTVVVDFPSQRIYGSPDEKTAVEAASLHFDQDHAEN